MMQRQPPQAAGTSNRSSTAAAERAGLSAYRVVDWTRLDAPPPAADVERLLKGIANDGAARLAILVATPKVLGAATVFAEQAELLGAQVRVFVGAKEAMAWLYRDLPEKSLPHDWPATRSTSTPLR